MYVYVAKPSGFCKNNFNSIYFEKKNYVNFIFFSFCSKLLYEYVWKKVAWNLIDYTYYCIGVGTGVGGAAGGGHFILQSYVTIR